MTTLPITGKVEPQQLMPRDRSGTFTLLTNGNLALSPVAISQSGMVAGFYDDGGTKKIFVRQTHGSLASFTAPEASANFPLSIDNATNVVGAMKPRPSLTRTGRCSWSTRQRNSGDLRPRVSNTRAEK